MLLHHVHQNSEQLLFREKPETKKSVKFVPKISHSKDKSLKDDSENKNEL